MHAAWQTNIDMCEYFFCVWYSLKNNGMVNFSVEIVGMVLLRSQYDTRPASTYHFICGWFHAHRISIIIHTNQTLASGKLDSKLQGVIANHQNQGVCTLQLGCIMSNKLLLISCLVPLVQPTECFLRTPVLFSLLVVYAIPVFILVKYTWSYQVFIFSFIAYIKWF